jgi:hypothetical protein
VPIENLPKPGVASGAAAAGAGLLADVANVPQTQSDDCLDYHLFGDLEAIAQKLARAGFAVSGCAAAGGHGVIRISGGWDDKRGPNLRRVQHLLDAWSAVIVPKFVTET